MIEYDTGDRFYMGNSIDDIVKQIQAENAQRNKKFPGRNPYPVDYNSIYKDVTKGLDNLSKIAHHQKSAKVALEDRVKRRHVTFRDAVNAAKSIVNITHGKIVDQEEMARRAKICSNCSLVNKNAGCSLCKFGAFITSTINTIRKMSHKPLSYPTVRGETARDSNCGYCGCSHVMILPATIDCFNESEEKNLGRPTECWIRKDSPNYKVT